MPATAAIATGKMRSGCTGSSEKAVEGRATLGFCCCFAGSAACVTVGFRACRAAYRFLLCVSVGLEGLRHAEALRGIKSRTSAKEMRAGCIVSSFVCACPGCVEGDLVFI